LIPELTFVIGEQPPPPALPPAAAKARVQMTLRRLLGVFARAEHPLALFLDDLQWLDGATLDLLENILVQPEPQHLLLVGAYRDNEVDDTHPLMRTLSAIRERGTAVQEIVLEPLERDDLSQWFADALRCPLERASPLAQLVHEKTVGNPFFVNQFLQELVADGLVAFESSDARWQWDLGAIRSKAHTDNVVALMITKLRRLPPMTQEALKDLACLGHAAQGSTLAIVHGTSVEELHSHLWEALRQELIVQSDGWYRFVHDRVEDAAYSLIPEAQCAEIHLRIGKLLLAHNPPGERGESIFEVVNQLNRGATLIRSQPEREQLAELNLMAGQRAKGSAAFASALTYFGRGAALVGEDCWERRHDLAFALELNRAECEYSTGQPGAEEHLNALAPHADAVVERAAIACLRIDLYQTQAQTDRAIAVGLDFLRDMGIDWSPHPSEAELRREYERIRSQLGPRAIEDLIELPVLSDQSSIAILDVLAKLAVPAHASDNNLHGLVNCRAVSLSIERGNCEASCYAYVWLGAIAGAQFGDYEAGYRFGRIGYELGEQRGWRSLQPATYLVFGSVIVPWARHVKDGRDLMRRGIESANSIGDLHFAVGAGPLLHTNMLAAGDHLADVERVARHHLDLALRAGYGLSIEASATLVAFVRTLRGLAPIFGCLDDEQFEEAAAEHRFADNPNLQHAECRYWIRKLQARFFAGDYAAAITCSSRAERLLWTAKAVFEAAEYHLYSALSRAARCDTASRDGRQQTLEAMAPHQAQLDIWARNCPENFENRAWLVGAEIARIEGRELDAERLYEDAIRSARDNGFVHNEALANETAARFYADRGLDRIARTYWRWARDGYRQWGADGKVRQLEIQHPFLTTDHPASDSTRTIHTPADHFDLSTVLKLSQVVRAETDLERLIASVMRLALEHAGAERGLLIVPHPDGHRIEADARSGDDGVTVDLRQRSVEAGDLPQSVLQYVIRTGQRVLVTDAAVTNEFADDEYFRRHHTHSVLCIPLLKHTRLAGIIYLENTLTSDAFTPARIALLEVLASDAAISLENTRLYHDLQKGERESRLIVETIPGFVASLSPAGEVEFVNKGLIEYCGQELEAMKEWGTNGTVHIDDLPRVVELFTRGITFGEPYEFDARIRRYDGIYRWFQIRGLPLRDRSGQIIRWYSLLVDIEDRKLAEDARVRQAGVRVDVNAAFSKDTGLAEILRGCAEAIVRHLDAAFARIWMMNTDEGMLELQASAGMYTRLDGSYSRISVGDLKVGSIAREKKPHLTNDVINDPRIHDQGWARSNGMVAFAGYPLVVEDRLIGVVALFARRPLSESILDTLASVAGTIAQGIERKRAEHAVREREREARLIVDSIPGPVALLNKNGDLQFVNRQVVDYTGQTLEELQQWATNETVHPDDLPHVIEVFTRSIASGSPYEIVQRLRRSDGAYRWFQHSGFPVHDSSGEILLWCVLLTDIDERKRAETELGALKDQLYKENLVLRDEIDRTSMFEEIVGTSPALQPVLARVAKVAKTESTVLITGETGTGKELVARAIHRRSARGSRAFVSVNCAAVPRELIASELFGHEKGAFTGATQRRLGRFELAHGGTVFLDEVGELPMETQVALLRVLQEREFERVGGSATVRVDVRVIAATNRDLQAAIAAATFRSDLFYRLNVFPIAVPPLRGRDDDIPLLVEYFVNRYARKAGKTIRRVNKRTLDRLRSYPWPGNVRELQNVIERSVIVCDTDEFTVDESWVSTAPAPDRPALSRTLAGHEKAMIEDALRASGGRVFGPAGAATRLGIARSTLESKIRTLGIDKNRFRSRPPKP
jgi:PAS domain S-box-containing protein